ncbi:MAG: hypothetical protein ABSG44_03700 [Thermodesulfobacteriota bacterium]|jgi:hypothetical protein
MKKILLMLVVAVLVSGCAIALKPDFAVRVQEDLRVTPVVYYRADWIQGVYGYPSFVESMSSGSKLHITRGALVAADEKVAFVRFDKQIEKYDSVFELKYPDITDVRVFRKGLGRRLVLKAEKNLYTLEIVKGGVIDRIQTCKFAVFIADRIGKDSSEFSKELERLEKKSEQEQEPEQH